MMPSTQGSYSLSNYLTSVQRLVENQIPSVWVHGTIASLQEKGKMVYITLAEYEEDSVLPKASLSTTMFAPQYQAFCRKFSELPVPFQIKKDLKVKVLLKASFYIPQGRFQCKIADIDAAFTIGEIAITRAKIWERLVKENLHRLNGELPMPLLPLGVGLITSEGSAAYNDFISTIKASGYAFNVVVVSAKMQGQSTETDIIEALGKLREYNDLDVVCIVRGGGAKTDLVFFDSYALCKAASLFPLPVITGIGHEIDESLLDRVAHTHLITPTDCANYLIEMADTAWQRLQTVSFEFESFMQLFARELDKLSYKAMHLSNICEKRIAQEKETLSRNTLGLKRGAPKIMDFQKQALNLLEEKSKAANPEIQLKRGYTITKNKNGKILRSAKEVAKSSVLRTVFADGEVSSTQSLGAIILLFCSVLFAQIQGETPALTPFVNEIGTHLTAMPTYTYSRMPGAPSLKADEEIWRPDKWKNRQIFNRFVPMIDWETGQSGIWFYTGNELGDMLWQELNAPREPNRTPMLYGGFNSPVSGEFYALAQFNQIDHFSEATFKERGNRINSQKFSLFGENLPAYSGVFGGFGYNGAGEFFKKASVLTGSEYIWAYNENEWVPIRISPRVEGSAGFYFMENEIELSASTEQFQIKDSTVENHSNLGMRLIGKNTGGGLYASRTKDKENIIVWSDFNHSFLQVFTNKGFIAFSSWQNQSLGFVNIYKVDLVKPFSFSLADSLEYKTEISNTSDLIVGVLLQPKAIKLYGETTYNFKPLSARTKAYQNYSEDFQSVGFDSELAYKSRTAEAGLAYSKEFFEYYRERIFYDILPQENSAKLFFKYRFFESLSFTHEWIYPRFWNAQIEQKIPEWNTSLYAVLLNAVSKDKKDFDFGGINSARFFCGINVGL